MPSLTSRELAELLARNGQGAATPKPWRRPPAPQPVARRPFSRPGPPPMELVAFIPGRLVSLINKRGATAFQTSKYLKSSRRRAGLFLDAAIWKSGWDWKPEVKKAVTFLAHVGAEWDWVSLRAATKPHQDSLMDVGLIHEDRPSAGHQFEYKQDIIPRKQRADRPYGVTVTVRLLDGNIPAGDVVPGAVLGVSRDGSDGGGGRG